MTTFKTLKDLDFDVPVYGPVDAQALQQMVNCLQADDAVGGALMGDHHVGYSQPIGGVAAYTDSFSISGVGFDIGCGLTAVRTNLQAADIDLPRIMDEIERRISFGIGRANNEPVDHPVLDKIFHAEFKPQRKLYQRAKASLGSVGSGNHFIDLLVEEGGEHDGSLWVATHFGSRGFGHATAGGFLALAQGYEFDDRIKEGEMMSAPVLIDANTELGQAYYGAMTLASDYAYAGRDFVVNKVLEILGAQAHFTVANHHNAIWREEVNGTMAWVARKGATPAQPGVMGFVGGSMGDICVVVEGLDVPSMKDTLYSTVHGAGRKMSRAQALGKIKTTKVYQCRNRDCEFSIPAKDYQQGHSFCPEHGERELKRHYIKTLTREGKINWTNVKAELAAQGIEIRGAGADEAPGVYKDLTEVLASHEGQIAIRATLRPIGVAMAGEDVIDPFKD